MSENIDNQEKIQQKEKDESIQNSLEKSEEKTNKTKNKLEQIREKIWPKDKKEEKNQIDKEKEETIDSTQNLEKEDMPLKEITKISSGLDKDKNLDKGITKIFGKNLSWQERKKELDKIL